MGDKVNSNETGLRYAEEASLGVLPGTPNWKPREPNSYNDFGGQVNLLSRNPLRDDRQRSKGAPVDLDASGGWNEDLTMKNMQDLLQGFMFAALRPKAEHAAVTNVDGVTDDFEAASGMDAFNSGDLVLASGFGNSVIDAVHRVTASTATNLTVGTDLPNLASIPAGAKVVMIGFEFGAGELAVDVSGTLPVLNRASGTKDLTDFGLVPGEFIFVGGDAAANKFDSAEDNGFVRVKSVTATQITLDKTPSTMSADTGTGKTIRLYFGRVLKNEVPPLIVRKSYQLERTLGSDANGVQSEYLVGAVPGTITININTADKINMDLGFVGIDHEQRDGATGVKSGNRPSLVAEDAINTSTDFTIMKVHSVDVANANPTPLAAFMTEMRLSVDNKLSPDKAITKLGAFDVSYGTFEVSGSVTMYFKDIAAVSAVRNSTDVTMHAAIAKDNLGLVIDVPLIGLSDGRLNVTVDQPITIPLRKDAYVDPNLGHTLLWVFFDYLPVLAEG